MPLSSTLLRSLLYQVGSGRKNLWPPNMRNTSGCHLQWLTGARQQRAQQTSNSSGHCDLQVAAQYTSRGIDFRRSSTGGSGPSRIYCAETSTSTET
eukprot:9233355-Pyramimonas_sp.AAC.1